MKTAVVGALISLPAWWGFPAPPAPSRTTLVRTLHRSEGCASCVKAGQFLKAVDDRPQVLTLTFPVDYWDYLGWRDTFAKPEFYRAPTRLYAPRLALRDVYTPQVIVDGRLEAGRWIRPPSKPCSSKPITG